MARSDSFFIRATVDTNGLNYAQTSIDLGSFVDALGKTVMRIHNISVQYGNPTTLPGGPAGGGNAMTAYQLTTQSQTDLVNASNRSVISSGKLIGGVEAGTNAFTSLGDFADLSPQVWNNGYLIAVESIFLATDSVINSLVDNVTVVLECTVETMTAAASMALALSQQ
tara:strand:+ start:328 stop:831 length:504 start_codon:yes stop_codon:yes gene_type:complete